MGVAWSRKPPSRLRDSVLAVTTPSAASDRDTTYNACGLLSGTTSAAYPADKIKQIKTTSVKPFYMAPTANTINPDTKYSVDVETCGANPASSFGCNDVSLKSATFFVLGGRPAVGHLDSSAECYFDDQLSKDKCAK
ncbi:hypothetical protein CF336_g9289 [Tilletia laevis]|nr:hypothetical protein CF336_g9289 [Tilletia laevis]KAE8181975.1 hypothetical protein CF328_g8669 [Tilletia controversa]